MSLVRCCSGRRVSFCILLVLAAGLSLIGAVQERKPASTPSSEAIQQNNIGVGYMNQYLFEQAADAFRKALTLAPGFSAARINLGIALLYNEDLELSRNTLEAAITEEPNNPYAHFSLGLVYKSLGETDKALQHFGRVTEIDGKCSSAFYNLGVLHFRKRNEKEAESALRRTLELDPINTSALYNLGTLLLQTDREEEGNRLLTEFRAMQQKGGVGQGMGVGNAYGEMGEYALALDYKPHVTPKTTIPGAAKSQVPFVDRSAESGVSVVRGTQGEVTEPWSFNSSDWSLDFLRTRVLGYLGGGIALADFDGDGSIDVIVTRYSPAARTWQTYLLLNDGKGHFRDATEASGIRNSGGQISAAIGDYDNDGRPDVYLVGLGGNRLYRNLGGARFEDVTLGAGVTDSGLCVSATFVDYDHDGDLDLYVSHYADVSKVPSGETVTFPSSFPGEPNRMYRNNGNGTFTDYGETLGVGAGQFHHLGMVPSDVDNDRDIDLVVLSSGAAPRVYSNDRNDHFTDISEKIGLNFAADFRSLSIADFNHDGWMDLFLSPAKIGSNRLLLNRGDGSFISNTRSSELVRTMSAAQYGSGTGFLDFDNDGNVDVYVFRGDAGELFANTGDGNFISAGPLPGGPCMAAASADFNGDGRPDVLCLDRFGGLHLLVNESQTANHWVGVQLEGLRSNKFGFGAKVEVRAGEEYQKIEIQGHNGYLSQDSPIVWIGLGQATKADTITVRWPSGILQSEISVPADRITRIKELDRKGTSCPLLYTWNGSGYEFISDFLGGCAIGYLEAPGRYSIPDTDEYVKIDGSKLVPRDGKYLLNLNNQLEEVIMFDQAQLLVVDHPAGTGVYPNERLMPGPPFPEFKIYTTQDSRIPLSAVDQSGNDILPFLAMKDRRYATNFRSLPFKGYTEPHSITLDHGNLAGAHKVLLLMDGWIDYADSSSNLAASQAGLPMIPPYLQVKDAGGNWQTAILSMGFPAGLPKVMTVDLTGRFPSADHHVRIVTNMKIYWDQILIDTSLEAPIRVTRLDPISADLHFRGYPKYYTPDGKLPWIYEYKEITPTELWGSHAGAYTRFGDVRELLLKRDDKYVITHHGDEVSLSFDARSVPALPKGWIRDYLLYADGYGKDMDMNSLFPEILGPLPFHGMSSYPYPANQHYPKDEEHRRYLREYNTRFYPSKSLAANLAH
ncbi:MAG TPA: FG-GAP-like repeat-containing protein [Acidobacteriota bacterium]|nr:FG-GAP-like repeat-containing protein [Acidobacteriota bacterium]